MPRVSVQCCIAGGGPAGMMLGLLLARAGVVVTVLEKHADFLRDFRGDTIHPSTLMLMDELGLLERFLKLPHQRVTRLAFQFGERTVPMADFSRLGPGFMAIMPQWDFLNFLAEEAKRHPSFTLRMEAEVTGVIERDGQVHGVTVEGGEDVIADLVVGADGRDSSVRRGMAIETFGAPMDVLWFRLGRSPGDAGDTMGRIDAGRILVMINRGQHWQMGYVIPKGTLETIRAQGIEAFRADVARLAPFARDHVGDIGSWDDVKLLTVLVDRLKTWHRPGLLCIGDAAHAMSPIGGVGVNLAVQDAVAAANILAGPLRERRVTDADLQRFQRRREFPTRLIQGFQVTMQREIIARVLETRGGSMTLPIPMRLISGTPALQRLVGRVFGLGVRPEHIRG